MLTIIHALDEQIELLDTQLRRLARSDPRLQALCAIFGVGPVLAAQILAELGAASRFRRARQVVRLSGLDAVGSESADLRRRGRLAKQGSPELRWAGRRGGPPRLPTNAPRPRSLHERQAASRHATRHAHLRAQDRPSRLPRPRRSRAGRLTDATRRKATPSETTSCPLPRPGLSRSSRETPLPGAGTLRAPRRAACDSSPRRAPTATPGSGCGSARRCAASPRRSGRRRGASAR